MRSASPYSVVVRFTRKGIRDCRIYYNNNKNNNNNNNNKTKQHSA